MAAAVPLAGPRAAVTAVGPFGDHVARLLISDDGYERRAAADMEAGFASGVALVIASWRPLPSLWEEADELAFRYAVPWLPVVMEHPRMRIGPWVDPRLGGPCHRCYRQRKIQHDRQHAASSALEAAYDRDPGCGPRGYLPHHARVAAAIAAISVRSGTAGQRPQGSGQAGLVSVINVLTWQAARHHVVAVHGCSRCGRADRLDGRLSALLARAEPIA